MSGSGSSSAARRYRMGVRWERQDQEAGVTAMVAEWQSQHDDDSMEIEPPSPASSAAADASTLAVFLQLLVLLIRFRLLVDLLQKEKRHVNHNHTPPLLHPNLYLP